ncbi:hypothetical protein HPB48_008611 [Haemaphysalis longicornis]|uniref:Uncharacterized protein n=1 Tax=Haemaphysalis longicornis TaxID=44386 RepID=A0A9J6GP37_HAELO|nr:hypothetical protein HPB48_008611 [Haemaphysalis longicornis]
MNADHLRESLVQEFLVLAIRPSPPHLDDPVNGFRAGPGVWVCGRISIRCGGEYLFEGQTCIVVSESVVKVPRYSCGHCFRFASTLRTHGQPAGPNCRLKSMHTLCRRPNAACIHKKRGVNATAPAFILTLHNDCRSQVAQGRLPGFRPAADMQELLWDDELAGVAQLYSFTRMASNSAFCVVRCTAVGWSLQWGNNFLRPVLLLGSTLHPTECFGVPGWIRSRSAVISHGLPVGQSSTNPFKRPLGYFTERLEGLVSNKGGNTMSATVFEITECTVALAVEQNLDKNAYTDSPWSERFLNGDVARSPSDAGGEKAQGQCIIDHNECLKEGLSKSTMQEKPFCCEHGLMVWDLKSQRKHHMRAHTPASGKKCEIRLKMFRRSYSLVKPMLILSGDKSFECSVCGKKSSFRSEIY